MDMQEQINHLLELAAVAKKEARKSKLQVVDSIHKLASNKRMAKKITESLFVLEDIDQLWCKLGEEAERDGVFVAREDNLARVNKAIDDQAKLLSTLGNHLQEELGKVTIASKSPLGWKLVSFMEEDPDFDKESVGFDTEEVRAVEKKMVQYDRDLSNARKASQRGGQGHGKRDRSSRPPGSKGDSEPKIKKTGNNNNRKCYNCDEKGHISYACPKKKKD